jgi:hypothetical protein
MAGLPAGVHEVQRVAAPGGGYYVMGSDGGVFAVPDEQGRTPQFYGSVPGVKGDSLAGHHQFGPGGLTLNPAGGYTVTDQAGHQYGFDTNYARANGLQVPDAASTLPSDPAYMAFMRASGLGLQTAANQVRQNTASINAALQTSMGNLQNDYDQQAKNRQGGYESRGVLRSGETQQGLDQVERARANAVSQAQGGAATQIQGLNQTLAQRIADVQNQAAERGLSTAQTQDMDSQLTQLKNQYPEYYAGGGK